MALVLLPLALDSHMSLVNLMVLASVGAIGLNLLVGYTGQVSLGHGAFMMVGSYTAALVTLRLGAPFWVGLPAGGAVAALVGTFFGIPSLRIKGLYLAIATLAGQFIIEWTINHSTSISGGVQSTIYVPTPTFFGWEINSEYRRYFMLLPIAILAYVAAMNLVQAGWDAPSSPSGTATWRPRSSGWTSSATSSCLCRELVLRGRGRRPLDLLPQDRELRALHPGDLGLYLAMIIIGGLGSVLGSVFGAVFITLLPIVLVYVARARPPSLGFSTPPSRTSWPTSG